MSFAQRGKSVKEALPGPIAKQTRVTTGYTDFCWFIEEEKNKKTRVNAANRMF